MLRQAKNFRLCETRGFPRRPVHLRDWPESLLTTCAAVQRAYHQGQVLASVSSLVRHVSFVQAGEMLVVPRPSMMEMQLAMRGAGDIVGAFALSSLTDQNVAAAKWKCNVVAASSEAQHPFPFHPSQQEPTPFQHLMSCRAASSRRSRPVWCQVRLLEMTLGTQGLCGALTVVPHGSACWDGHLGGGSEAIPASARRPLYRTCPGSTRDSHG